MDSLFCVAQAYAYFFFREQTLKLMSDEGGESSESTV
jgi:hypothetical protein